MSDGYCAWRTLEGATHLGCMAHSRRHFVNALKTRNKPGGPPQQALKFYEQLYRVERQARNEKPDKGETRDHCIRRFRQQHSVSVLNTFKEWLDEIAPKGLAGQQARRCRLLYPKPMGLSDTIHRRRQDADRQQSSRTRYQNLCHRQKELAVQRHRRGSQGQCRRLQPGC